MGRIVSPNGTEERGMGSLENSGRLDNSSRDLFSTAKEVSYGLTAPLRTAVTLLGVDLAVLPCP